MSQNTSDPAVIEQQLEQTRSRLGTHLTELQNRFTPGQVIDDLTKYFRGKEGAEFGRSLVDSVRANPLPAALTGIGLAWLMASNPRGGTASQIAAAPSASGGTHAVTMARLRVAEQSVVRQPNEAEDVFTSRLDDARAQAIGMKRDATDTAASFGQRIRDALTAGQQAVLETAHDVGDRAGDAAGSVTTAARSVMQAVGSTAQDALGSMSRSGQTAGQTGSRLVASMAESPVLLGALGLAAGALLGALLPQSDQEEEALGDIAGQARNTVRSVAKESMERGTQVAQAVLSKGKESIQDHGLAGDKSVGGIVDAALRGSLAGDAKQVLQDTLNAGDEAIRKEALIKQGKSSAPGKTPD